MRVFLAADLGASSGRVVAGIFDGKRLSLEEVHRFANNGVQLPSGWHWPVLKLFGDIKDGIAKAKEKYGDDIVSLAVATWGVDYGLIDRSGRLLGFPWMYRDDRTQGMIEAAAGRMPREEIYRRTGIQFMFFNTLLQLLAETRSYPEIVGAAERILFTPDLMNFWLTGQKTNERTIASTSQMLKVGSADWDLELIEAMGIPAKLFHPTIEPASVIGGMLPDIARGIKVVACGSHDTASAVAGVPAEGRPLFLSSGTWSLIGRELPAPLVSEATHAAGYSNEQGLDGTTRFLKNAAGMWLLQECRRNWAELGYSLSFGDLVDQAEVAHTKTLIDPDAPEFQKPCDMPAAIAAFAEKTAQQAPRTPGETTRVIFESLALRYRSVVNQLRGWMPDMPDTLHIVGGGSQNAFLNRMSADATGLRVVAGPVEATAAGNVIAQMIAVGEISSLQEGRALIRDSFEPNIFEPDTTSADWEERAGHFAEMISV